MYKLMIVDDEPLIRNGIVKMVDFKSLGIGEVYPCKNGVEALSLFKEKDIDIVLADINMPKMDGLELSEQLKKENKNVKIALITGYDYFDYALSALKMGVNDYVLKPVSKKDVYEIIKKLIRKIEDEHIQSEVPDLVVEANGYKLMIESSFDHHYLEEAFNLQMLADDIGLTTQYLSTIFKELFDVNFQDYLLEKRMEKAKRLLLTTDLKNYEIAEQIGFSDPNYFSTRFKKEFGVSPKQYKEKIKKS